jgi:hypothetical protein
MHTYTKTVVCRARGLRVANGIFGCYLQAATSTNYFGAQSILRSSLSAGADKSVDIRWWFCCHLSATVFAGAEKHTKMTGNHSRTKMCVAIHGNRYHPSSKPLQTRPYLYIFTKQDYRIFQSSL